ncbi:hypothetical protein BI49514_02197 [Brevibacterium iodinum ATCC 49514]|uniref:Uncharacterized protein n=1 Tax=Brevibacterium iodinum ATCC 49514 TaxID=1255616 RepID=A0A2H1JNN9_9MICO|nr:hypothetical protein BI49514_02197 [Brevibacterium iodinum ATCC 49514]SUW12053.1 Uncharacterised protein [Brevibacterium iodinum]
MDPAPDAAARVLSAIGEEDYGRLLAGGHGEEPRHRSHPLR